MWFLCPLFWRFAPPHPPRDHMRWDNVCVITGFGVMMDSAFWKLTFVRTTSMEKMDSTSAIKCPREIAMVQEKTLLKWSLNTRGVILSHRPHFLVGKPTLVSVLMGSVPSKPSTKKIDGGFKYFLCSPRKFGEDSHCDEHIFQIGLLQPPITLSFLVTEKFLQIGIRGVILNTRPTRHVLGKKKTRPVRSA